MKICVFCSSSNGIDDCYYREAENLGAALGKAGHELINGGAGVGLMESITLSARKSGAHVTGILPERMIGRSLASGNVSEIVVTADMAARKAAMRDRADAFVALAGGFGTLEEVLEVITLKQLSYHHKPVVFINTNQFYDKLLEFFETFYARKFAKDVYRGLYYVARDTREAMEYIHAYVPGVLDEKWHQVPEK